MKWLAELRTPMVERDAWTQYHLLNDGAWWEVSLEPIQPPAKFGLPEKGKTGAESEKSIIDVVLRAGLSGLSPRLLYGRPGIYAVGKRQLSKREIKRLKLSR